jgi:hypothetical protein
MASTPENGKKEPTPAEQFMQQLEKPLGNINRATELNNDAVRLFTEGKLTVDELIKASVGLAKGADNLADKILRTDPNKSQFPDTNQWPFLLCKPLREKIETGLLLLHWKN